MTSRGFRSKKEDEIVPVEPFEIVRPTRVVWIGVNKLLASKVLPTEARAWAFAADLPEGSVVVVQDAAEPPPVTRQAYAPGFIGSHRNDLRFVRASSLKRST